MKPSHDGTVLDSKLITVLIRFPFHFEEKRIHLSLLSDLFPASKNLSYKTNFLSEELKAFISSSHMGAEYHPVFLSLKDMVNKFKKNEFVDRSSNVCCLITLPHDVVMCSEDFFTKEISHSIPVGYHLEDFQLQYFLLSKGNKKFSDGNWVRLIHEPYKKLYESISTSKPEIKLITQQIENLFNQIKTNQEKEAFMASLKAQIPLNCYSLFRFLAYHSFSNLENNLLIHGIMNILAFSPEFNKQLDASEIEYKKDLKKYLVKFFPLTLNLLEIIIEYEASAKEEIRENIGSSP